MMWDWIPWWHWLVMAGVWTLGIAVIAWAITALFPGEPRRDPRRVLDERFARGELDTDEYRARRDELDTHTRAANRTRA